MKAPASASKIFYEDTGKIGSLCFIECQEDKFCLVKVNWGATEDYERNRDGEVELIWGVREEALTRLKKICNNSKTPDDVVRYLYERFIPYNRSADHELLKWFDKKEIAYVFLEY